LAASRLGVCLFQFLWFAVATAWLAPDRLGAQEPQTEAPKIVWEPTFEEAIEKAKTRQRPLFVAFIMDDEPGNDAVLAQHFKDPEIVKLSARMVCVVGNVGKHGTELCTKFGCVTCDQHQETEKRARARYLKTEVVRAPQFVFCDSTGSEMFRKVYLIPKRELQKSMAIALSGAVPEPGGELAAERARVDQWLKDADSKNGETRDAAFATLATATDSRAIPALMEKAKPTNNDTIRCAAIKALGVKGNHAALGPLMGFLSDKNTRVCLCALVALGEIQLPDPALAILKAIEKEKSVRIKARALRSAARIYPESAEVQKQCFGALKGASAQLQEAVMMAIYHLPPDPRSVAALRPLLTANKESTRALAAWILGKQDDETLIPVLEKMATSDKSPDVRSLARKATSLCQGKTVANYEDLSKPFFFDDDT